MLAHAIGDTVGYKNGEWEFMTGGYEIANEKLYQFIAFGGVNHISLKGWLISDDTILHIKTAEALLEDYEDINKLGKILTKKYIEAYDEFLKEGPELRNPGKTTLLIIKQLKNGTKWNEIPYDFFSGGSGASMRTPCMGLMYHGEKNRYKLIQIAIESSRMTHNSTIGYLGGLTTALFTAFAIEGKDIKKWPFLLLELLKREVQKYIVSVGRDIEHYEKDNGVFINKWKRYVEDKFDSKGNPIERRSSINPIFRSKYYKDNYGFEYEGKKFDVKDGFGGIKSSDYKFIGSGGDDSVIIAYDCLLDAGDNWEKLCVYSMMHMGDTDTTGCIAGALYGAVYGINNIPKNFLEHLERKNDLKELGKKLYKKSNIKN